MSARSSIQHVEAFHLAFLRALESRLDRSAYVVKGGVNLRAWFGSARCSEDLDLDVVRVGPTALAEKVDRLLSAPPLTLLLRARDLSVVRVTKPKQTETTQRWKLQIQARGETLSLPTKIEFSRRGIDDDYALEPVLAEVVRPYGIPTPTANHYTASAAIRQKVRALAQRSETQARDIWDLDHLFRTTHADARPLSAELRRSVPVAVDRVLEMPFSAFKAQVVPYVAEEHQELYGTAEAWDRMRERVIDELMRLVR